jgi:hypothetical protein
MVAIPPSYWTVFNELSDAEMAEALKEVTRQVSLEQSRKTPRGPKKPPPKRSRYRNGEHVATAKVLAERKKQ